jgi:hypothetical protein
MTETREFDDAFREYFDVETGSWKDSLTTVKKNIKKMTYEAMGVNIGIASNGVDGARALWNAKYKDLGFRFLSIVYESSSDNFREELERDMDLLIHLDFEQLHNEIEGCGHGSSPYVVYVVWKPWPLHLQQNWVQESWGGEEGEGGEGEEGEEGW